MKPKKSHLLGVGLGPHQKIKAINGFLLLKDKVHNFSFAFSAKLMKLRQAYSSKFGTKACSGTRQLATSGLHFKVFN